MKGMAGVDAEIPAAASAGGAVVASSRWRPWLAYAAAWLGLGLWLGINVVIGHRNSGREIPAWEPMSWELSSVVVVAVLAIGIFRFERRHPLSGPDWLRRVPLHVPAAIAFSLLHTLGMVGIRKVVYVLMGSRYDFGDPLLGFAYELQKDLISYALIAGACVAWRAQRARRERELAVLQLERDLGQARLAQLTAQIEPHFMFNTLNAISNRMHEDVEAADRMIAALAVLMRVALSETGDTRVRVVDDVVWLERYFELMRERFRGKLETQVEVEPAARDARIPRLLLQPLVENAFEHGLASGRGRVQVTIGANETTVFCTVEDDGRGLSPDYAPGVGLSNVRHRLELMYPGRHRFAIAPGRIAGTRIEIELPFERDA
ncbi:signal transduction histidine kinase [Dokdonella fugitiva]|uniref:Signal transduction histidine kinase n=1 Tax=Dokdonella fugitiva TaxID=328517 RepID=A0A839F5H4_9GAMM|nr:histidine kinase [Dokdonella fugitiva]MBA8889049.1 signal transduction histidine kinase [Dokdonella fugitiva]